jgi:hypothetical protein
MHQTECDEMRKTAVAGGDVGGDVGGWRQMTARSWMWIARTSGSAMTMDDSRRQLQGSGRRRPQENTLHVRGRTRWWQLCMGHQERLSVRAHTTSTHTLIVHAHTCTHARTHVRTHMYHQAGVCACVVGMC